MPEQVLNDDHEAGKHVWKLVDGCPSCERMRPDVERTSRQVRFITGGQPIPLDKGWLRADPPTSELDDLQIEARLEAEHFEDMGADPSGEW